MGRDSLVTDLGVERKDTLDCLELNDSVIDLTNSGRYHRLALYYQPTYGASESSQRQGLMLLFLVQFYIFASSFASKIIAALPEAETGGTIATLLFIIALMTFNGVMQLPHALPGFCIFMYRVLPLTYVVPGITATALQGQAIQCASAELSAAAGQLYNPSATQNSAHCRLQNANQYLGCWNIYFCDGWRNWGWGFGLGFAYIAAQGSGIISNRVPFSTNPHHQALIAFRPQHMIHA
ncbi:uncharacterized protein P174DRAFT_420822 [Aspergillus novofumigatus IBT 16806]|uniref:ABC-2 type transporter transmembrane domain-containing protein n=1 Tax=Aspergillus novofumigatus (strain IBT 16806) TaxID=1392255 RepID=A0A2I1C9G1_ASPN1|nr:uncharacterized protein P174DRAFT_420822 [Aspergillus novofumigatus IBT 16806]PKX94268.1 hypothetical protein P174DRAFT_420822 [Aspergillus novofumigatus IBT 16806]